MQDVLLVIHLLLALGIIGLVLLQRSEGGGLGIGNSGGLGGLSTPRGTADALTRLTAIFAACFFCTSIALGIMARPDSANTSILDSLNEGVVLEQGFEQEPPIDLPSLDPEAPAGNEGEFPSVPLAQ